jgi:hypothetical protein
MPNREFKPYEMTESQSKFFCDAWNAVIAKIPADAAKKLVKLWGDNQPKLLVIFAESGKRPHGVCSRDGLRIELSDVLFKLPQNAASILIAHEIAHAFQVAAGQMSDDTAKLEKEAIGIMKSWGFNDAEFDFWDVYRRSPGNVRERMRSDLMQREPKLMKRLGLN